VRSVKPYIISKSYRDKRRRIILFLSVGLLILLVGVISYTFKNVMAPQGKVLSVRLQDEINKQVGSIGLKDVHAVVSEDLIATLRGSVNVPEDKRAALTIAKSYKELKEVKDNIQVKVSPPPAPDPTRLEAEINRELRTKGLKNVYAEVNKDLIASLRGSVERAEDKAIAFGVVQSYKQLKEVKDNIQVKLRPTGEGIQDDLKEAIAAFNNFQYDVAIKMCQSILRKDPNNRTAQQYLQKAKEEQEKAINDLLKKPGSVKKIK
jgi:osmotically-inducible protein OsmY